MEKLTQLERLYLSSNQLTEVPKGLEKLPKLTFLNLLNNHALTKAQIDDLLTIAGGSQGRLTQPLHLLS